MMTDLSLQRKVGKEDKEMVIIKQMVNKWIHSAWDWRSYSNTRK